MPAVPRPVLFLTQSSKSILIVSQTCLGNKGIEDPPGIRGDTGMQFYLAYLLDPAGNKVCAMHTVK